MKKQMISKMNQFLQAALADAFESFESAFRGSMTDYGSHATCLWIEDGEIESEIFATTALAAAEMLRHEIAFVVPKSWHEKKECDWIWVETDDDPESETFGEDLWCCMGVSGEVARFYTMSEMWDTLLDYTDDDWKAEAAIRVMDYMRTWEEPVKTLIRPTTSPAPAPEYGDQSPLLPVINVFFDHQNNPLSDIETLQDAILAMDIDGSMDCGFSPSDVWDNIERGATPLTFGGIFTPLANDLCSLGVLAADGHLEISAEYTAILISLGVTGIPPTLTNRFGEKLEAEVSEHHLLADYQDQICVAGNADRGLNESYYCGTRVLQCTICGAQWEEENYSCGTIFRGGSPCGC